MNKILIIYFSKTGNTKKMAEKVAEGIKETGCEFILKSVEETKVDDLLEVDGIIVGSPTYFGLPAAEIKKLFDESVVHFGKLEGKVGGAFTSSANIGGGNETTILSILPLIPKEIMTKNRNLLLEWVLRAKELERLAQEVDGLRELGAYIIVKARKC